ncbi:MAG TPA: YciI family protein [Acidimicrobiales bacterium]|nr:YciI family protein [Acidimicrobiales bacterium]
MPQYMISVCHDDTYEVDFSTPEAQRLGTQVGAFNEELQKAGAWVFAAGLHPASSATVVRSSGGVVSMTDGPYAETKEQMGGFWMIDAADLDAALEWANRASAACEGPVEVRPAQG